MVANHQRLAVSPEHLASVRALRDPPVGRDHPAYQPCDFAGYVEKENIPDTLNSYVYFRHLPRSRWSA
ncbi:unnamed protein product [Cylicocyclus nassatus]|uniref:Uncharacterized protein n=1 Tax=Cylicocyclus nassatus TaxID=53992 RepID=A0AA36H597_CYLNA|nr:unnamed protein product [Cylicocyclus nassatus]